MYLLVSGDGGNYLSCCCVDYNESEANFSRFFGRGTGLHNSLLIAYNKLPALDSPKLQVVIEATLALEVQLF